MKPIFIRWLHYVQPRRAAREMRGSDPAPLVTSGFAIVRDNVGHWLAFSAVSMPPASVPFIVLYRTVAIASVEADSTRGSSA